MNEDHISEDLHFMIEERQGRQDYIESWFNSVIGFQCSIIQYLLTSSKSRQLASHIQVHIKECLSNLHMSLSIILLQTWFHWKYSYTWTRFSFSSRVGHKKKKRKKKGKKEKKKKKSKEKNKSYCENQLAGAIGHELCLKTRQLARAKFTISSAISWWFQSFMVLQIILGSMLELDDVEFLKVHLPIDLVPSTSTLYLGSRLEIIWSALELAFINGKPPRW